MQDFFTNIGIKLTRPIAAAVSGSFIIEEIGKGLAPYWTVIGGILGMIAYEALKTILIKIKTKNGKQ